MPTSRGGQVLATARSSTSQASSSNLRSESSAARCHVFPRKDPKLLIAKTQAQLENAKLQYSLNFKYSASSPVPMPANNTARPAAVSTRVYMGGCLIYIRFLQSRIKLISLEMDLLQQGLEQSIRRLHRVIDVYTAALKNRVKTITVNRVRGSDLVKRLQRFNAKKDLFKRSFKTLMHLLNVRKRIFDESGNRKIEQLNSKFATLPQGLDSQCKLLDFIMTSHTQNYNDKMECLTSRYSSFCKMFSDDCMAVDL